VNGHDDARLDSIAVLALGALPAGETRELRAHMAGCEICRNEYAELRAAADALALSAEATSEELGGAQSARLKARVMDAVRADLIPSPGPVAPSVVPMRPRIAAPRAWLPYAAMAAALVIATFSGYSAYTMHAENESNRQQIALLQARLDAQERTVSSARAELALNQSRLADMIAPGATQFAVHDGVVVRSGDRVMIAMRRMPALPKGKVYQAWTMRRGAKTVTPSMTFVPDATGLALVELPGSATGLAAVAVSVEPEGGSKAPTTKPMFVRLLS
jgi:hypothetical protein